MSNVGMKILEAEYEKVLLEINTKLAELRSDNDNSVEFVNPEVKIFREATGVPDYAIPFPKKEEEYREFLNKALEVVLRDGKLPRPDSFKMQLIKAIGGVNAINEPPQDFTDNYFVSMKRDIEFETTVLKASIGRLESDLFFVGGKEDLEEIIEFLHTFNIKVCTKIMNNQYREEQKTNAPNFENVQYAIKVLKERTPEEKARRTYKSITRPPEVAYNEDDDLDIWNAHRESIEDFKSRQET